MEKLLNIFKRVLVLCPHTDDEFGCAGTIRRLIEAGADVKYIAMSNCEASVPENMPANILEIECFKCTEVLGIDRKSVEICNMPVRHFPEHRQEILEKLVKLNRTFAPDLVLLPSSHDIHQDHATVYMEGVRAFKHSTLLGYEMPQNLVAFTNSSFVVINNKIMKRKIKALSCYASQKIRKYSNPDFIMGLARVRGVQSNHQYAEAYEVIRLILS
jgi:LmbE family N-acetylglucosaminyl deacetylase